MAHHDQRLTGDADALVAHLDETIVSGSMTATLEHAVDHTIGDARMLVRVYERYSAAGGNRLSLSISVLAVGTDLSVRSWPPVAPTRSSSSSTPSARRRSSTWH
ncbi:DUF6054 family protein [Nocardioides sp. T2.26MG-1]|uniref:DUF6054 family protein n=1 Tax=Nocardioides sp. T2.26MG-1 TaxID=3041166 RepID=UPI002477528E|nr:DUF6054 family protein [Nocardioides sp. T2.26MG-1]CAI9418806.1 hypothetical protein HIDPHFAB_03401 [Nocardioides sp. T2.26MG-1]